MMAQPAPHNGEMHPDGDEVLFLISGRLDVVLEEDETQKVVEMTPGQTLIVPKESGIAFCRASPASCFTLRPDQVANGDRSRTPFQDRSNMLCALVQFSGLDVFRPKVSLQAVGGLYAGPSEKRALQIAH